MNTCTLHASAKSSHSRSVQREREVHTLRADNLPQVDDVGVVQILEQLNLADGCDGKALLLCVHPDLLQRHLISVPLVSCQIHLHANGLSNCLRSSHFIIPLWIRQAILPW